MRLWKNINSILCCAALAACAPAPGALVVQGATLSAGTLEVRSEWQPDARVLDALDHGIALSFAVRLRATAPCVFGWPRTLAERVRHVQLRYYPLVRQYQLRDLDAGSTRSYASRAQALVALGDLRLPLPEWNARGANRFDLRIALERDALPGALRLPALLTAAWRVDSGEYAWRAAAG
jgi:hypothetical protein